MKEKNGANVNTDRSELFTPGESVSDQNLAHQAGSPLPRSTGPEKETQALNWGFSQSASATNAESDHAGFIAKLYGSCIEQLRQLSRTLETKREGALSKGSSLPGGPIVAHPGQFTDKTNMKKIRPPAVTDHVKKNKSPGTASTLVPGKSRRGRPKKSGTPSSEPTSYPQPGGNNFCPVSADTASFPPKLASPAGHSQSALSLTTHIYHSLKLWGDGYDALEGRLDEKLQYSSQLRGEVVLYLYYVAKILACRCVGFSQTSESRASARALLTLLEENESTLNSFLEDAGESLAENYIGSDLPDARINSLEEILEGISTDVECLVELTPALDCPAEDSERGGTSSGIFSNNRLEAHRPFVEHISSKYPNADTKLVERLAKRTWEQYLRLMNERNINETQVEQAVYQLDTKTAVTGSKFHDSAIGSSLPATTTYAPTAAPSIVSSVPSVNKARLPVLSDAATRGEPFDCIACGKRLRVTNHQRWKDHLLDDLQPYVCVYPNCETVLENSLNGCHSYRARWTEHLAAAHPFTADQKCPLCLNDIGQSTEKFLRHVSQHLEELALIVLPQEYDSDSDLGSEEDHFAEPNSVYGPSTKSLTDNFEVGKGDTIASDQSPLPDTERSGYLEQNPPGARTISPTMLAEDPGSAVRWTPYVRPQHPIIMCNRCDDHPEGFRGEYELRRHVDRVHSALRICWITVDVSPNKDFLSGCKACRSGKQYGAYYNAATHLRRAHFNRREEVRSKPEKREGKAAGDWPPMGWLKQQGWIKEILVENHEAFSANGQIDVESDIAPLFPSKSPESRSEAPLPPLPDFPSNLKKHRLALFKDYKAMNTTPPRVPSPSRNLSRASTTYADDPSSQPSARLNKISLAQEHGRPFKCPVPTCEYHQKGFARAHDKSRHTLTHYKGTMTCSFCPGLGSAVEKSFNRADVFKRHLMSVHGVEQTPPNSRKKSPAISISKKNGNSGHNTAGTCSICSVTFASARGLFDHLDDCVIRAALQTEAINQRLLASIADDKNVKETMEGHLLS